jgi:hypothetical protein
MKYAGLQPQTLEQESASARDVGVASVRHKESGIREWVEKLAVSEEDWTVEPFADEAGQLILIRYRGKPSRRRYEFIRDYFDLKVRRLDKNE